MIDKKIMKWIHKYWMISFQRLRDAELRTDRRATYIWHWKTYRHSRSPNGRKDLFSSEKQTDSAYENTRPRTISCELFVELSSKRNWMRRKQMRKTYEEDYDARTVQQSYYQLLEKAWARRKERDYTRDKVRRTSAISRNKITARDPPAVVVVVVELSVISQSQCPMKDCERDTTTCLHYLPRL